jgi:hypothetical protein
MISDEYAAGFFDGDGCIHISRANAAGRAHPSYALNAAISGYCEDVMRAFQERWGGAVNSHIVRDRRKPVWQWSVQGMVAKKFISTVEPYLIEKRAQAKRAADYPITEGRTVVTPEVRAFRDQLYHELRELKR